MSFSSAGRRVCWNSLRERENLQDISTVVIHEPTQRLLWGGIIWNREYSVFMTLTPESIGYLWLTSPLWILSVTSIILLTHGLGEKSLSVKLPFVRIFMILHETCFCTLIYCPVYFLLVLASFSRKNVYKKSSVWQERDRTMRVLFRNLDKNS